MKKLFRKLQMNKNNKGFSLVEVLLAIAILALIATPVFNTIISSYKMNLKSRKMLAAQDVLNATMEYAAMQTTDDYTYPVMVQKTQPDGSVKNELMEVPVKGLSSIYNASCSELHDFTNNLYLVYPKAAFGGKSYVHTKSGNKESVRFSDVKFDGYDFDVEVTIISPTEPTDKYYTKEFKTVVYDHIQTDADGSLIKYCEASTRVANIK